MDNIQKMKDELIKDLEDEIKEMQAGGDEIEPPLSIDVTHRISILLSFGGPSSGIDLDYDNNGNLIGGYFWDTAADGEKRCKLNGYEAEVVQDAFGIDPAVLLEIKEF